MLEDVDERGCRINFVEIVLCSETELLDVNLFEIDSQEPGL
jgi:hypothetical protein